MEFSLLGPLEVRDDGRRIAVGAPKQRSILAVLVLHANEVVSTDRLLDLVWGDEPPTTGSRALPFHISKLRNALQPDRVPGEEGAIVTRSPGYVLEVDDAAVDLTRFERLVAEAHALVGEDPARVVELVDEALALWRGTPLADFAYEEWAQLEIHRLEEMRQMAVEDRIDAGLALGRHDELIGELRALIEQQPLQERPWAQLMTALYRSGRQAEALAAYRELSRLLGEELGIEPSADLAALEEQILQHDPELAWSPPATRSSSSSHPMCRGPPR